MNRAFRELEDRRPGLQPPRFTLRALFWLIAALAMCLGLAIRMGPVGTLVGVLAVLSILAHMASTAIGGQLRQNGARSRRLDSVDELDTDTPSVTLSQPVRAIASDFAPATQLSQQRPLERRPILWAIGIGAAAGSLLAAAILTLVMWNDFSIVNVLFGAASAAVLGSFMGFWLSSLYQVARKAWRQADSESTQSSASPTMRHPLDG